MSSLNIIKKVDLESFLNSLTTEVDTTDLPGVGTLYHGDFTFDGESASNALSSPASTVVYLLG